MAQEALRQWIETVSRHMPHLSRPQATILALWSFGVVMARSCGLTTVSAFLASVLGVRQDAIRERLRDEYREAAAKKGKRRIAIAPESCFASLLRWVLSWWDGEQRLALALDVTTLADRFAVLVISVVYRGCAIPVAWKILPANQKEAWKPYWKQLLSRIASAIPASWFVLVIADRGLYARWLYQEIQRRGWHPFLRINHQGCYRLPNGPYQPLAGLLSGPEMLWSHPVICFKTAPLVCTLLVARTEGKEPWLIVTDLSPAQADAAWYGLRSWIEGGFKDIKRGGWQWQQTRISDPERAERFWLIIAIATLWVVSVGGEAEATRPVSGLEHLPETHIARRRTTHRSRPRLLSCFRQGICQILSALITGQPLPLGRFCPQPWPTFSNASGP